MIGSCKYTHISTRSHFTPQGSVPSSSELYRYKGWKYQHKVKPNMVMQSKDREKSIVFWGVNYNSYRASSINLCDNCWIVLVLLQSPLSLNLSVVAKCLLLYSMFVTAGLQDFLVLYVFSVLFKFVFGCAGIYGYHLNLAYTCISLWTYVTIFNYISLSYCQIL